MAAPSLAPQSQHAIGQFREAGTELEPGKSDEPQHAVMGVITQDLLTSIGVECAPFPASAVGLATTMAKAPDRLNARNLPYALVMAQGSVADEALEPTASMAPVIARRYDEAAAGALPTRIAVLERFPAAADEDTAVIATTGECGRELFTLADRRQHLYQLGSMGDASAMGLGVAFNVPNPVAVLDGDGAGLMKLRNLATIGAYHLGNLLHIVLDDGVHDSTGGQATVSASVDFAAIALACGYCYAASCRSLAGFETALSQAARQEGRSGAALIHIRIAPGSLGELGRPTVGPEVVARRFWSFLREHRAR